MLFIFRKLRKSFFLPGKAKTYLAYAVGEIFLIMIGIFLALQLNNWNDRRLDRIEEREILGRIYDELQGHIERIAIDAQGDPSWMERIDRVIVAFDGRPIEDNIAFLNDAIRAGSFSIRRQVRSTYAELLSGGRFGIIQNIELRNSIFEYYDRLEQMERRADERRGDYPRIAYKLIPRTGSGPREGLSDEHYARLVQTVLKSDLHSHVIQERNRGEFTKEIFGRLTEIAKELQTKIQTELNQ